MKFKVELLKKNEVIAAISAFITGICIHLFGLVNTLHNYDDIAVLPQGYGTGVLSGRWALTVFGNIINKFWGNYNLPLVNGVIFILFIALSAALFVATLDITNRKSAVLIGMIFITFPSATATLFFKYTATYYGFAICLSVLAAWIIEKPKYGFVLSCIFTAVALGIYQAYLPITVGIFVLKILKKVLNNDVKAWEVIRKGLYYCASIIVGLVLYYLILKLCLWHYDVQLGEYQGVSSMGKLSISALPQLIWKAFSSFLMLPLKDYCDIAQSLLLKLSYLILGVISIAVIVFTLAYKKKPIIIVALVILICLAFPIATNLIVIMCPDSYIYSLMVYAFVLILCVPLVLLEVLPPVANKLQLTKNVLSKVVSAVLLLVIVNYSYQANVNYSALYYSNRQTENYLNSMIVQVRMTEGFDADKEWAIIGKLDDPLLSNAWQNIDTYAGNANVNRLFNSYSRSSWIYNYYGYSIKWASDEKISAIQGTEEFKNMPCWPSDGSIEIIDETVVIKLQNVET